MARVCNLYRERVRSNKTVLFLIVASLSLSSGETLPTKCRPCQKKILTTTVATVKNQEKRIQNKMKVLQLTNKNRNKIAASNLLKLIRRHCKLVESKLEECYEIIAIVQELKIGKMKKKISLKIRVWVFKKSWASTRRWSKNLKTWKKVKGTRSKRNSSKRGESKT